MKRGFETRKPAHPVSQLIGTRKRTHDGLIAVINENCIKPGFPLSPFVKCHLCQNKEPAITIGKEIHIYDYAVSTPTFYSRKISFLFAIAQLKRKS